MHLKVSKSKEDIQLRVSSISEMKFHECFRLVIILKIQLNIYIIKQRENIKWNFFNFPSMQ